MTILHLENKTLLSGPITDQVGLRGVLDRIWDLNLVVVSVSETTQDQNNLPEEKS
jgi:hypothetical protein